MIYEFEDVETGEVSEHHFAMDDAPGIGATIKRGGRVLRRLAPRLAVSAAHMQPFMDRTLPYNYKYHAETGGRFDKEGRCLFDSPSQMRNLEAMARDNGENIRYPGKGVHPLVKGGKKL